MVDAEIEFLCCGKFEQSPFFSRCLILSLCYKRTERELETRHAVPVLLEMSLSLVQNQLGTPAFFLFFFLIKTVLTEFCFPARVLEGRDPVEAAGSRGFFSNFKALSRRKKQINKANSGFGYTDGAFFFSFFLVMNSF